jgi:hypothetical protein
MVVGEKVEVVSEMDSGVKWPVHCTYPHSSRKVTSES